MCPEIVADLPMASHHALDVLLIVDDSPSMSDEVRSLYNNINAIGQSLSFIEDDPPSMHIAVVASTQSEEPIGTFETTARIEDCRPPDGAFLTDIRLDTGEREQNYTGTLAEALLCIATLPATGGFIEEPLEAMRRALDGSVPGNDGFFREHATLLVVFVTDEDDCSGGRALPPVSSELTSSLVCFIDGAECRQPLSNLGLKSDCRAIDSPFTLEPVAPYVEFLSELKKNPSQILVSVASGPPEVEIIDAGGTTILGPSCVTVASEATPSLRLDRFRESFPHSSRWTPMCSTEWWRDARDLATLRVAGPSAHFCVPWTVDLAPREEGIQHECVVAQIQNAGQNGEQETLLPKCSSAQPDVSEQPCWRIETSPDLCGGDEPLAMQVYAGPGVALGSALARVQCQTRCRSVQ